MDVLERYGWEKGWKFVARKEKKAERVLKSLKVQKHPSFLEVRIPGKFSIRGKLNRCDGLFILNKHGDLYFSLHKNIVHIILLSLRKKLKNCGKEKKI